MIDNQTVVCEASGADVIIYEASQFGVNEAAEFMERWKVVEDRNFFVAKMTLTPLEGD